MQIFLQDTTSLHGTFLAACIKTGGAGYQPCARGRIHLALMTLVHPAAVGLTELKWHGKSGEAGFLVVLNRMQERSKRPNVNGVGFLAINGIKIGMDAVVFAVEMIDRSRNCKVARSQSAFHGLAPEAVKTSPSRGHALLSIRAGSEALLLAAPAKQLRTAGALVSLGQVLEQSPALDAPLLGLPGNAPCRDAGGTSTTAALDSGCSAAGRFRTARGLCSCTLLGLFAHRVDAFNAHVKPEILASRPAQVL